MKIAYSPYVLIPKEGRGPGKREGVLLKFSFEKDLVGYADCHPWTALGDLPLIDQLKQLSQNQFTPLTWRSQYFARLDAQARLEGKNLFEHLPIPPSYASVGTLHPSTLSAIEQARERGFKQFKIKLGDDLTRDTLLLNALLKHFHRHNLSFRLDFNLKLTYPQWEKWRENIAFAQENIEFCEDPFPFNASLWEKVCQEKKVQLACDLHSEQALGLAQASPILICKPAIQDESLFLQLDSQQQLVFTSYLDHPLGQMAAAYIAAKAWQKVPHRMRSCGLLSHEIYLPDAFSECLGIQGTQLLPPEGTGFGFDHLLPKLDWFPL
jgi:O-succinylbenzoate synthase